MAENLQDLSKGERQEFGFLGFYILNIIRTQLNKKGKVVETPMGWRGISELQIGFPD